MGQELEFPVVVAALVFKPQETALATRAAENVDVGILVEVHRLGVDGNLDLGEHMLVPAGGAERILGRLEPRDLGRGLVGRGGFASSRCLVRGHHFQALVKNYLF